MNQQTQWELHDPYVYHLLTTQVGAVIGLQTTRGELRGKLKSVEPDHLVVEMGGVPFHVRTAQVVWFFPVS